MASRNEEAQPASNARLLARRHFLDRDARCLDPARKRIEIGLARDLEPDIIHSRHIRLSQDDAVAVELVPGPQIGATIRLAADLVEADAIDIMLECRIQIGHPDLDITRSKHTLESHGNLLFTFPFNTFFIRAAD